MYIKCVKLIIKYKLVLEFISNLLFVPPFQLSSASSSSPHPFCIRILGCPSLPCPFSSLVLTFQRGMILLPFFKDDRGAPSQFQSNRNTFHFLPVRCFAINLLSSSALLFKLTTFGMLWFREYRQGNTLVILTSKRIQLVNWFWTMVGGPLSKEIWFPQILSIYI